MSDKAKVQILESAVLNNDISEVRKLLSKYDDFEFTARALGFACRYTTLEMVKLLVGNSIDFSYEYSPAIQGKYGVVTETSAGVYYADYRLLITAPTIINDRRFGDIRRSAPEGLIEKELKEKNSEQERLSILRFLKEENVIEPFWLESILYQSLLSGDNLIYDYLKSEGIVLHDYETDEDKWRGVTPISTYDIKYCFHNSYACSLSRGTQNFERLEFQEFVYRSGAYSRDPYQIRKAFAELSEMMGKEGLKLKVTKALLSGIPVDILDGELLSLLDITSLTAADLFKKALDDDNGRMTSWILEKGFVKTTKQRDQFIDNASVQGKTECLAVLMDYKNRTADSKKEAERELRKLSVTAGSAADLKKDWGVKKQEDGTYIITAYKGNETRVIIPDYIGKIKVTAIDSMAFYANKYEQDKKYYDTHSKIESITIPGTIDSIPAKMISNEGSASHESLKEVFIEEGVKEIGDKAFSGCNITSITIPSSVETIGESAFSNCSFIKEVRIPGTVKRMGNYAFGSCGSLESVHISEGINRIGDRAFSGCNITSVTIPYSVETIGERAFCGCSQLKEIIIPDSVKEIGDNAFGDCDSLQSVVIGSGLQQMGSNPFEGCDAISQVDVSSANPWLDFTGSCLISKDHTILYSCFSKLVGTDVVIPEGVISIESRALSELTTVKTVVVPSTLKTIGPAAFYKTGIKEIKLPESIERIAHGAFAQTELQSISLPDSIDTIEGELFEGCEKLVEIKLPTTLKMIQPMAFEKCNSLERIQLPDGLQRIEIRAFNQCSKLKTITIPDTVTYLGLNALGGCIDLKEVIFKGMESPLAPYENPFPKQATQEGFSIKAKEGAAILEWARNNGINTSVL